MRIRYLDGRRFRQLVIAGADWVRHRRDQINGINVFPVPDGDTGTNMALSLSATASALRPVQDRDLAKVAGTAAEAALLGAKGNSGVILAHWFLGFAAAVDGRAQLTAAETAEALRRATERVYGALERPVEGTIISVMRGVSERLAEIAREERDLAGLAEEALRAGNVALARTPEQLAVLRDAKVVDAGPLPRAQLAQGAGHAIE